MARCGCSTMVEQTTTARGGCSTVVEQTTIARGGCSTVVVQATTDHDIKCSNLVSHRT
jgi:hypothetical protein